VGGCRFVVRGVLWTCGGSGDSGGARGVGSGGEAAGGEGLARLGCLRRWGVAAGVGIEGAFEEWGCLVAASVFGEHGAEEEGDGGVEGEAGDAGPEYVVRLVAPVCAAGDEAEGEDGGAELFVVGGSLDGVPGGGERGLGRVEPAEVEGGGGEGACIGSVGGHFGQSFARLVAVSRVEQGAGQGHADDVVVGGAFERRLEDFDPFVVAAEGGEDFGGLKQRIGGAAVQFGGPAEAGQCGFGVAALGLFVPEVVPGGGFFRERLGQAGEDVDGVRVASEFAEDDAEVVSGFEQGWVAAQGFAVVVRGAGQVAVGLAADAEVVMEFGRVGLVFGQ